MPDTFESCVPYRLADDVATRLNVITLSAPAWGHVIHRQDDTVVMEPHPWLASYRGLLCKIDRAERYSRQPFSIGVLQPPDDSTPIVLASMRGRPRAAWHFESLNSAEPLG